MLSVFLSSGGLPWMLSSACETFFVLCNSSLNRCRHFRYPFGNLICNFPDFSSSNNGLSNGVFCHIMLYLLVGKIKMGRGALNSETGRQHLFGQGCSLDFVHLHHH